jgi:hypothetical protein
MVCTPIYSFLAPEGKYLEPGTSSHPIEAEGYEIRPNFISFVKELNFAGGLDENPYKHLQAMRNESNLLSQIDNPQSNSDKQEGPGDGNYARIKAQDKTRT